MKNTDAMAGYVKTFLLCVCCMICLSTPKALATRVFGTAKEYAGSEIIFYHYQERITYMKEEVFHLKVDENGNFEANFGIDRITYIFAEFGVYYVYFYAEPDGNYELLLRTYRNATRDKEHEKHRPQLPHNGLRLLLQPLLRPQA